MKILLSFLLLALSFTAQSQTDSTRRAELNASAGQLWAMKFRGATVNQAAERIHRYFVVALDAPQAMNVQMSSKSKGLVNFTMQQGDGTGRLLRFTFISRPDAHTHEFVVQSIRVDGEAESVLPFFIRFWDNRFATTGKRLTYRMGSEEVAYIQTGDQAVIKTN